MFIKFKELAKDWKKKVELKVDSKKKSLISKNLGILTMCKQCYTFRYNGSWHFERPESLKSGNEHTLPVKFTQCPVCMEQENSLYETESDLVFGMG